MARTVSSGQVARDQARFAKPVKASFSEPTTTSTTTQQPVYQTQFDTEGYNAFVAQQQAKLEQNVLANREAREARLQGEQKIREKQALGRETKFARFETNGFLARRSVARRGQVEAGRSQKLSSRASSDVKKFVKSETARITAETEAAKPSFETQVVVGYSAPQEVVPEGFSSAQFATAKQAAKTKYRSVPISGGAISFSGTTTTEFPLAPVAAGFKVSNGKVVKKKSTTVLPYGAGVVSPGYEIVNGKVVPTKETKEWQTTGGTYLSGTGQLFSSQLSPEEKKEDTVKVQENKSLLFQSSIAGTTDYSKGGGGLAGSIARIKANTQGTVLFQGDVKVGNLNEPESIIQERASTVLAGAKQDYTKGYAQSIIEGYNKQKETTPIQPVDFSKFAKDYPLDAKYPSKVLYTPPPIPRIAKDTFFTTPITNPLDISDKEFDARLSALSQGNIFTKVAIPKAQSRYKTFVDKWSVQGEKGYGYKKDFDFGSNFLLKDAVTGGFEVLSDIGGGVINVLYNPEIGLRGPTLTSFTKSEVDKLGDELWLNPKQKAIIDLEKRLPERAESDFYTGKLAGEVAAVTFGGPVSSTVAFIGESSRGQNVFEVAAPLALGGVFRVAAPKLGGALSKITTKADTKLTSFMNKTFTSKVPVPQNMLATSRFSNLLTEDMVAKALLVGGSAAEVAGIQFIPLDQKEEYIKQVGLINALTPIGYKTADVGILLGRYGLLKPLAKVIDIPVKPIKDVMTEKTFLKFSDDGGGTPVAAVDESALIGSLQKSNAISRADVIAKEFDVVLKDQGLGAAYRSIDYKLPDKVDPWIGNYEGRWDFFAPEAHPIAFKNVGLKAKLFDSKPDLYSRYRLSVSKPGLEYVVSGKGTAITSSGDFTADTYKNLKNIYGYEAVDKYFDLGATGKSIGPKIKIDPTRTIAQTEIDKIVGGGRPFKNRDLRALFGEEAFDAHFLAEDSVTEKMQGFFSTQSRSIGRTTESEVFLSSSRERIDIPGRDLINFDIFGKKVKVTTSGIKKKLGLADAYIEHDFELIPLNVEKEVLPEVTDLVVSNQSFSSRKLLVDGKKAITGSTTKQITGSDQKLLGSSNMGFDIFGKKTDIVSKEVGGYTAELSRKFGAVNPYGQLKLPVITNISFGEKKDTGSGSTRSVSTNLSNLFSSGTVSDRGSSYVPGAKAPIRTPSRTPDRIIDRTSDRLTDRTPDRIFDRGPNYGITSRVPDRPPTGRVPIRLPDYKPLDRPPTRPDEYRLPTRTPPYRPPTRTPPYRPPVRTPPYRPPTRTPPPRIMIPIIMRGGKKKKEKYTPAYEVFTRKKGKLEKIAEGLPQGKALLKGLTQADVSTQRTTVIKRKGLTTARDVKLPKYLTKKFRLPTPKSSLRKLGDIVLIEKSKYAIGSLEEKKGIPGRAKQLKKLGLIGKQRNPLKKLRT